MRSIDTEYITPVLREEGLVKLNSFGFMMTRTLAENYPYTKVYKAAMRGARAEWIAIVDGVVFATPISLNSYVVRGILSDSRIGREEFQEGFSRPESILEITASRPMPSAVASVGILPIHLG